MTLLLISTRIARMNKINLRILMNNMKVVLLKKDRSPAVVEKYKLSKGVVDERSPEFLTGYDLDFVDGNPVLTLLDGSITIENGTQLFTICRSHHSSVSNSVELSEEHFFNVTVTDTNGVDMKTDFDSDPVSLVNYICGNRSGYSGFSEYSRKEFTSTKMFKQDEDGELYVVDCDPYTVKFTGCGKTINLFMYYNFPFLHEVELPTNVDDAVCLCVSALIRGCNSIIYLLRMMKFMYMPIDHNNLGKLVEAKRVGGAYRYNTLQELKLCSDRVKRVQNIGSAKILTAIILAQAAKGCLAEPAVAVPYRRDWCSMIMQLFTLVMLWGISRRAEKRKEDPLLAAFNMAKTVFIDPESQMKSNSTDDDEFDFDGQNDRLQSLKDKVSYLESTFKARHRAFITRRLEELEFTRALAEDNLATSDPIQSMTNIMLNLPLMSTMARTAVDNVTYKMVSDMISHLSAITVMYLAGKTHVANKLRAACAAQWLGAYGPRISLFERPAVFCMTSNEFQQADFTEWWSDYQTAKKSPLFASFKRCVVMIAGCTSLSGYTGVDVKDSNILDAFETFIEGESMVAALVNFAVKTLNVVHAIRSNVPWKEAIMITDWRDTEFIDLYKDMETFKTSAMDVDAQELYNRLNRCTEKTTTSWKTATSPATKAFMMARLDQLALWKKNWRARILQGVEKPQPFSFTITGPAGIGKSSWVKPLLVMLHKVHESCSGEELVPCIGCQNSADKYDSNISSRNTAIIVDDVGFVNPDKASSPVAVLAQRYVNPFFTPLVKASVDEKGVDFNMARFVAFTSNHKYGWADHGITDPNAGVRRLGVFVAAEILPQYTRNGIPDPRMFPPDSGGFGEHCTYTFYSRGNDGRQINEYKNVSAAIANQILMLKYKEYYGLKMNHASNQAKNRLCNQCCLPEACGCVCQNVSNIDGRDFSGILCPLHLYYFAAKWGLLNLVPWTMPSTERERIIRSYNIVFSPFVRLYFALMSIITWPITWIPGVGAIDADILRMQTTIVGLAGGASALAVSFLLMTLAVRRFAIVPYIKRMVNNLWDDEPPLNVVQKKEFLTKPNPWAPVVRNKMERDKYTSALGVNELFEKKIKRNVVKVEFPGKDKTPRCHGCFLKTGYLLLPGHSLPEGFKSVDAVLTYANGQNPAVANVTLKEGYTVRLKDKDLLVVFIPTSIGSRPDLTKFLCCNHIGMGNVVRPVVDKDGDLAYSCNVRDVGVCNFNKAGNIKCFRYAAPFSLGDCGLPVLYGDENCAMLCGFHIGYDEVTGIVGASCMTKQDWSLVEEAFLKNPLCIATTEKVDFNVVPGFERSFDEPDHWKNPINYVPEALVSNIETVGNIGKFSSNRTQTKMSPLKHHAENFFRLPDLQPVRFNNAPLTQVVALAYDNDSNVDFDALMRSTLDARELDMKCIDCVKKFKQESGFDWIQTTEGAYTISQVVNGIPGSKHAHGLNKQASAGEPYRRRKDMLLSGEPGQLELDPIVVESVNAIKERILRGEHSGTICKMALKDEPRPSGKADKARVFQSTPIDMHILYTMHFGPLMHALSLYPEVCKCAVGVSFMDKSWDDCVGDLLTGEGSVIEYDISSFDLSIPNAIRVAGSKLLAEMACYLKEDYSDQLFLERLAFDYVVPLCSVNGAILEMKSLHPSGILTTAFLGSKYGKIANGVAYYRRQFENYNQNVNSTGLGDDFLGNTKEERFTLKVIGEEFALMGMHITSPNKDEIESDFVDRADATFLRRKTRYHPCFGHGVGQLDGSSVLRAITTIMRSKKVTIDEQLNDQVAAVATESLMYPKRVYDSVVERLKCIMALSGREPPPILEESYYDRIVKLGGEYHELDNCPVCVAGLLRAPPIDYPSEFENMMLPFDMVSNSTVGESQSSVPSSSGDSSSMGAPPGGEVWYHSSVKNLLLDREILLDTRSFDVDSEATYMKFPVYAMLQDPYVRSRLKNIYSISFTMGLRFVLNASAGHYCKFLVSMCPMGLRVDFQDVFDYSLQNNLVVHSSRSHIILDPLVNNGVAYMTIPWLLPVPSIEPCNFDIELSPVFTLMPMGKVRVSSDVNVPVTISVYAHLRDISYSGATSISCAPDDYHGDLHLDSDGNVIDSHNNTLCHVP